MHTNLRIRVEHSARAGGFSRQPGLVRLAGVALLLACVGKILVMDAWGLAPRDRYITFIILGAALLLVSFLYSKYRETIRQFL